MTNYKNLEAWKKSMILVKDIYLIIKDYPKEEIYALVQQTRKAAVSIPSNIAEGIGRDFKKDTVQFFHISRGSIYELETQLQIGNMLGFISNEKFNEVSIQINECIRLLNGLINYMEKAELR